MSPEQVALVRDSVRAMGPRMDAVADEFYRRVFARDPSLRAMFAGDLVTQRRKFADELQAIVTAIPDIGAFLDRARLLGARHSGYGVRTGHYRQFRDLLLETFAAELGDAWTEELAVAWHRAYDMVAEAMMMGVPRSTGASFFTR
ncbi:globin domain-containing protein [Micromonospora echinofusca]|uniref:Hemin receptor n=1 Tax=Micromonospora echinofusca TaxID=47858 RepID=A0ABS3VUP2_MICEH|nr:globin domain-containing protein [Micromonospora echinofusca]MBO4208259.1 hemin receptor [Micromonospora echinofusca]